MRRNWHFYLVLLAMGATWGAVFPITKLAVSTGYKPYGILVWQSVIGLVLSGAVTLARGRSVRFRREYLGLFLGISLLGSVLPNFFTYTAAREIPAGIISIVIALVPLFSMPMALALGFERLSFVRLLGALCGALAIVLLIGPEASLPDPSKIGFLFLALVAPLIYAGEGNFMTWYGARGLDAMQILFGASAVGLAISLPLSLALGQFITPFRPWHPPEVAIFSAAILNWAAYVSFVWLIARTGPVFSSQVSYLVTGWGIIWSMLFLGERYSLWVWGAFALMVTGILLVRPKEQDNGAET